MVLARARGGRRSRTKLGPRAAGIGADLTDLPALRAGSWTDLSSAYGGSTRRSQRAASPVLHLGLRRPRGLRAHDPGQPAGRVAGVARPSAPVVARSRLHPFHRLARTRRCTRRCSPTSAAAKADLRLSRTALRRDPPDLRRVGVADFTSSTPYGPDCARESPAHVLGAHSLAVQQDRAVCRGGLSTRSSGGVRRAARQVWASRCCCR